MVLSVKISRDESPGWEIYWVFGHKDDTFRIKVNLQRII